MLSAVMLFLVPELTITDSVDLAHTWQHIPGWRRNHSPPGFAFTSTYYYVRPILGAPTPIYSPPHGHYYLGATFPTDYSTIWGPPSIRTTIWGPPSPRIPWCLPLSPHNEPHWNLPSYMKWCLLGLGRRRPRSHISNWSTHLYTYTCVSIYRDDIKYTLHALSLHRDDIHYTSRYI